MPADSPDALCAARLNEYEEDLYCTAVEVKTMTSMRTIEEAKCIAFKYAALSVITNIGSDANSLALFKELVPSSVWDNSSPPWVG